MLRPYLPGLGLSAAVLIAAIVVYATADGNHGATRPAQLAEGSAAPVLVPADEATSRRARGSGGRAGVVGVFQTGQLVAVVRVPTPPGSAGGGVPGAPGSSERRGVSRPGGGTVPPSTGTFQPALPAPQPVATVTPVPTPSTPASGGDDQGPGESDRVRAPEIAARPDTTDASEDSGGSDDDGRGHVAPQDAETPDDGAETETAAKPQAPDTACDHPEPEPSSTPAAGVPDDGEGVQAGGDDRGPGERDGAAEGGDDSRDADGGGDSGGAGDGD